MILILILLYKVILTTPVPSAGGGMPSSLISVRKRRATRIVGRRTLVDAPRRVPVARYDPIRFAVDNERVTRTGHIGLPGIQFPETLGQSPQRVLRPRGWERSSGKRESIIIKTE